VETLALVRIDPQEAARFLAGVERSDPRGVTGELDLLEHCMSGLCFGVTVGESKGVYVLAVRNGQAFIRWARGEGDVDLTRTVLPVIEQQCGRLDSLAFQTARPGLVRKATQQGYEVTGWILKKKLQP
jgi:hypothetical protein